MNAVLSIDQSTQGTKGFVWDASGCPLGRASAAHEQRVSREGWVGHDLNEIWRNTLSVARAALKDADASPRDVAVIGITNQRETACCWSRETGLPLCDAIVWQCGRAASICQELIDSGLSDKARRITGLPLSPYFSAPKFAWMLRNVPAVREAAKRRDLCFGTVDSYLVYRMTAGRVFRTDCSNASRTGLMNLDTLEWSGDLLDAYGLTRDMLPEIVMSDGDFGQTTLDGLLKAPVPIRGVLGDSHAALYAHGCFDLGAAKVTYGTGSSVMMNVGSVRKAASGGIVESVAWGMNGKAIYCLEGNVHYTGALITWLIQDMGMLQNPSQSGEIAASLPDNGGVYLVPAFTGLGAPHYVNDARAAIVGMVRGSGRAHIVRAAEEAICYQILDVVEAMEKAAGQRLTRLCADGGATRDAFLMGFQAGVLGRALEIGSIAEMSGAGAAYCAAVAAGLTDWETLRKNDSIRAVQPTLTSKEREKYLRGWRNALETVIELSQKE